MRGKSEALLIIMGLFLIVSLCLGPAGAKAQGMEQGIAEAMQAARAAGVPEVALNRVLTLSLERSVSPQYVSSFLTTLRLARMNDLAVEPFLLKIEEGLAKGIPPKSIALAARTDECSRGSPGRGSHGPGRQPQRRRVAAGAEALYRDRSTGAFGHACHRGG
jgi:hypothetical protein